jgi:hypothetical protein
MSTQAAVADQVSVDALVSQYEEAYVEYLDAHGLELEDRLSAALRVNDLSERLRIAGLLARMQQIHEDYRECL